MKLKRKNLITDSLNQGIKKKCEDSKLTALPKWLSSKNDFNEAIKLTEDIRADTNNVKSSSSDKKVFNDLDELINDIKDKKTTRKSTIKKQETLFLIQINKNKKKLRYFKIK